MRSPASSIPTDSAGSPAAPACRGLPRSRGARPGSPRRRATSRASICSTRAAVSIAADSPAANADRQHAAEAAAHLPPGDFVPGERRQARVQHLAHFGVIGEMLGDPLRVAACDVDAREQRAHAAREQPRLERADHAAELRAQRADALPQRRVLARDQRAGDHVGMPVEILRGRVHDEVGAERERLRQHGSCHGRIDGDRARRAHARSRTRPRCR